MVSLALGLALAIALAQGVLVPLTRAWLAARDAHAMVMARSARVLGQLAQLPPRGAERPLDPAQLLRSAAQAGVQLAPPVVQGDGLALAGQGPTAAVLAWLESLRAQGLVVRRLALNPLPEGGLACEAWVVPAGGLDKRGPNGG